MWINLKETAFVLRWMEQKGKTGRSDGFEDSFIITLRICSSENKIFKEKTPKQHDNKRSTAVEEIQFMGKL